MPNPRKTHYAKTELHIDVKPTAEFNVQEVTLLMWDGNESGFSDCTIKCRGTVREAARHAVIIASCALRMLQKHGQPPEIEEAVKVIRKHVFGDLA